MPYDGLWYFIFQKFEIHPNILVKSTSHKFLGKRCLRDVVIIKFTQYYLLSGILTLPLPPPIHWTAYVTACGSLQVCNSPLSLLSAPTTSLLCMLITDALVCS